MKITMAHGSGGHSTSELIDTIFAKYFQNPTLLQMEDSAVVKGNDKIAVTTDSFVVTPTIYPGGDIGRLAVCGTVNDLLMCGAVPQYLTCGFILEVGTEMEQLEQITKSMAETAKEAGVLIIAGDTKVIEGSGGVMINTAGVGFVSDDLKISAANCMAGDTIILSGNIGDHHAAILSTRMEIENEIQSDNAPLCEMVQNMKDAGVTLHAMRDVTRGGLATILHEFAEKSCCCMEVEEIAVPISQSVRGFSALLGLDPLYMGNEGKMLVIVPEKESDKAVKVMQHSRYGQGACKIGIVTHKQDASVLLHTKIGGTRILTELMGEGLPRIC